MTALGVVDRLQTIAATATVTSAVWIVVGALYMDRGTDRAEATPRATPAVNATEAAASRDAAASALLLIPVRGVAPGDLTGTFDESRGGRRHEAIDIMAAAGTPVVAAAPGTVERLFRSDAGGNTIYLRSEDRRTIHYYAHLQGYAPGLAEGQSVQRGQLLGSVGSTGNADPAAPHLHFAVLRTTPDASWWETGAAIDPYPLLVPR
jgi:murein DD-endopeptidase MepM/ murein hydrolase activator NlpD